MSKCAVFNTSKWKFWYWTLLRPKYWAWASDATVTAAHSESTTASKRNRIGELKASSDLLACGRRDGFSLADGPGEREGEIATCGAGGGQRRSADNRYRGDAGARHARPGHPGGSVAELEA